MKKVKVKSLAEKYKVTAQKIVAILKEEGIDVKTASSVVPEADIELVEMHLDELFGSKKEQKKSEKKECQTVSIKPPVAVRALADVMDKKPNEVIAELMKEGIFASINQTIENEVAEKVAKKFNFELKIEKRDKETHAANSNANNTDVVAKFVDREEDHIQRPPVVTFLGHVDHGKTSLQDKVRETSVVKGEAGGITQHIGASTIDYNNHKITFIDTPGHEAFTQMRARGAHVTDIAILVVAANDGFMPQTIEAMNHALAAEVPVIVAINKMDLPEADPDKVLLHMQQNNLMSEDWGGDVGTVRVSAHTGQGLDELLDRILLESEMLELNANPKRPGVATVLEAQLEQGLGATSNILVQDGTIKEGDVVICGEYFGRVKSMLDENGNKVFEAGPSTPVKLVGLSGVPEAGTEMHVARNEKVARQAAEKAASEKRQEALRGSSVTSADDLFSKINQSKQASLKIIIKSDVRGSGEAIIDSLNKLPSEKIKVDVVSASVGSISENDVMLAAASDAIIVGFHVRVNNGVNALAKREGVDIRLYSIIYELLEDITDALTGKLEPVKRENNIGKAKILKIFSVSKGPKVCGCMVEEGSVRVGAMAKVYRDGGMIFNGEITSLRRFQDDVKEVKSGLECGIRLDNFMDFDENDVIEVYEIELKKATL
ncbi:translation initiation factor IF-2 [Lentisphaerota bacterium WC36G]|nr:translation initiation factor IF-2 [Lentisphaerae bacterium WC36]